MSEQRDTPQGPVDPHGEGGLDAPAPPGGPQRTDTPGGSETPGVHDAEPGQAGHLDEPVQGKVPSPDIDERQEENAETSLDQPSG